MRIWITGIAGFLGSHLADALLSQGHEVFGNDNYLCGDLENVPSIERGTGSKFISDGEVFITYAYCYDVDCRNFDRMKDILEFHKPDVLIHCAATAHEGLSSFSPSFITKNIYEASVATFSAAIASGVKRIVYMSSMSRYGDLKPPFHEVMHPKPVDPYGIAKVAAEDTLKVLCNTHGVQYSILVPHNIIGTRQRSVDPYRNVASIMINRCHQGKAPIIYGDGLQTRCFSPVADCIPSIVKAVHGAGDGKVINIGPDSGEITIKELSDKIIALTGYEGSAIHIPDRPNEVKHAYCSSDKAREYLGYEPKQSIDDCLKEMVEFIKPEPFVYDFPLEIVTEKTPQTWKCKLI